MKFNTRLRELLQQVEVCYFLNKEISTCAVVSYSK